MRRKRFLNVLLVSVLSAGAVSASTLMAGSSFEIQAEAADNVSVSVDKTNVKPGEYFTITVKGAPGKVIKRTDVSFVTTRSNGVYGYPSYESFYVWSDESKGNVISKPVHFDNSDADDTETVYRLDSVEITYSDNTRETFTSEQIGNLKINLSTKNNDTEGPKLKSLKADSVRVKPGDNLKLTLEAEDATSLERAELVFKHQSGEENRDMHFYMDASGTAVIFCESLIDYKDVNGIYTLSEITIADTLGNKTEYKTSSDNNYIGKFKYEIYDSYGDKDGWDINETKRSRDSDYNVDINRNNLISSGHVTGNLPKGMSFDAYTSTLTLDNYSFDGGLELDYYFPGQYYNYDEEEHRKKEITIVIKGKNDIDYIDCDSSKLRIKGTGVLNIHPDDHEWYDDSGKTLGIMTKDFTLESGTVNIDNGNIRDWGFENLYATIPTWFKEYHICGGTLNINNGGIYGNNIDIADADVNIENGSIVANSYYNAYYDENKKAGVLSVENAHITVEGQGEVTFTGYQDLSNNHSFYFGKTEKEKQKKSFNETFTQVERWDDYGGSYNDYTHNSKNETYNYYGDVVTYDGDFVGYNFFQITSEGAETTAKEVKLDNKQIVLDKGKSKILKASVMPDSVTDKTITWSSSDEKIARVDQNGTVTAVNHGTAKITAKTSNGKTAECEVRVNFTDVASTSQYYYKPVYWAAENKITTGSNGLFAPHSSCTREHAITFLWRMAGSPQPKSMVSKFKDIQNKNSYSYKAIMWGTEKGIITGASGVFAPNNTCTREQIVTMLWRLAGKPAPKGTSSKFKDVQNKNSYSYNAILWASEKGITTGANGEFKPGKTCTRAEIVTFIYRYKNTVK